MAKGYSQTYGVDDKETFASVAKMNTVRILISLAINLDGELKQYGIKNGDLEEEIYMHITPGYEDIFEKDRVCRL